MILEALVMKIEAMTPELTISSAFFRNRVCLPPPHVMQLEECRGELAKVRKFYPKSDVPSRIEAALLSKEGEVRFVSI